MKQTIKSLFFYLVLIGLFLAGTKLVYRQQQYFRSIQTLAKVGPNLPPMMPGRDRSRERESIEIHPVSGHYIHVPLR